MVSEKDLLSIKKWFDIYVHQFCTGNERFDSAICLKVRHTKNVAREILDISNSLQLGDSDCFLAEITAFLHDIGRFEQYMKYQTYSDQKSEDHAKLGIDILKKTGVLNRLDSRAREVVEAVVMHHNKATLPESSDSQFLVFLKLLRDADKIDILQVVTEHYQGINANNVIDIGLPDDPEISDRIIQNVMDGKIARVEDMLTRNDFKLLQIGWVFDLNFPRSFELVKHRKYLQKISAVLPQNDTVTQAVTVALRHVDKNCANERNN